MTEDDARAQCEFHVRTKATDAPTWHYARMWLEGPTGGGYLCTEHPPAVGDTIRLYDRLTKSGGVFRVVERSWNHASYGSTYWPHAEDRPRVGPLLEIVVEQAEGLFRGEAPEVEEG